MSIPISEMIVDLFDANPRYRGVQANESMVLAACQRPVTAASLQAALSRIKHQLATSREFAAAFSAFYQNHPEYSGVEANTSVLASLHHGEEITAQTLEELLENPNVQARLAVNAQYSQAAQDQAERTRLISEIIGGIKVSIDGYSGREVCMDVAGKHLTDYKAEVDRIQNLPLEELRAYRDQKVERQRIQSLTPAQIREEVNTSMKAAWDAKTAKPELPAEYVVTVPNKYFPNGGSVPLTRQNFVRLEKADMRAILNRYGSEKVDVLMGKQPRQQVR